MIELKNVFFSYDNKGLGAINGVSLKLAAGDGLTLVGPSGEGKTTLLYLMAGKRPPQEGEVLTTLQSRDISFMHADDLLDENLSAGANIRMGLNGLDLSDEEEIERLRKQLEFLGLEYKDKRAPSALSAGQKQRVQLGRAFIKKPKLLIMDEPFSHLNWELRQELMELVCTWCTETQAAWAMATHHTSDVLSSKYPIAVIANGKMVQKALAPEVYESPNSPDAATALGPINLLSGSATLVEKSKQFIIEAQTAWGPVRGQSASPPEDWGHTLIMARPENFRLMPNGKMVGVINKVAFHGKGHSVSLIPLESDSGLTPLVIDVPKGQKLPQKGEKACFDQILLGKAIKL